MRVSTAGWFKASVETLSVCLVSVEDLTLYGCCATNGTRIRATYPPAHPVDDRLGLVHTRLYHMQAPVRVYIDDCVSACVDGEVCTG